MLKALPGTGRQIALPLVFAAAAAAWLGVRMWHGFYFAKFGDEIEHILGAQIIGAGGRLYRDFIDEHGPLPYAAAQAYGAIAGWAHPSRVRLIPALLTLLGIGAVAASPALRGAWERLTAGAAFMALLATFWVVQGLCFHTYQIMAGVLLTIAMAMDTAPAWTGAEPPAPYRGIAGACAVLTCFAAYAYGPAAVLLLASRAAARRPNWREWRAILLGGALALVGVFAWFAAFADPVGYFTFHFILNQVYFAPYMAPTIAGFFGVLVPSVAPDWLVQGACSIAGMAGWALLFGPLLRTNPRRQLAPALLGLAALVFGNPRASPIMQNDGFVVLAFAYLSLGLARLPRATGQETSQRHMAVVTAAALAVLGCEIAGRHALSSPHDFSHQQLLAQAPQVMGRSDEPWAVALRRAVRPDERVLALPFYPDFYLLADRLPMRGYYDYLPWEADYAKRPWFGRDRDLCKDLQRERPPVVFYNGWIVWGRYDPETYMSCVLSVLRAEYASFPGAPNVFVLRDRLPVLYRLKAPK